MMKLIALIFSYIVLCLRLLSPGGVRAVAAENIVLRHFSFFTDGRQTYVF